MIRVRVTKALLAAVTGAFLLQFLQVGVVPVKAQTADSLRFFKNFFVTGDYVVGGVGLRGKGGSDGLAPGTITISGVPANADIVAAYLYWQVVATDPDAGAIGVSFNGRPLSVAVNSDPPAPFGKVLNSSGSDDPLASGTAPCWASGGGTGSSGGSKKTYTYRADVLRMLDIDSSTGKLRGGGTHTVRVPDTGTSNRTPTAIGASLVVVYRDPAQTQLRSIVLYDGGHTMDNSTPTMSQTIKGFYQATGGSGRAKITHIVGSGQLNKSEKLLLPDGTTKDSPFYGERGENWDNPTFDVALTPGVSEATTSVSESADCLTWGAVVLGTDVVDTDSDGLVDKWEDGSTNVDPGNGQVLPNLAAMGARVGPKDVFIQIDYMETAATTYGGVPKPAHTHRPSDDALAMVRSAFAAKGITVHFEVAATGIDEAITNTGCTSSPQQGDWQCQFYNYPGTIGWKTGFLNLRDRRWDPNRRHMFRYALFAHAIGLPKSEDRNLPDFHVPRTNTGAGDFPGADILVTLGAFPDIAGNPVGTPYMQAATLMHELGHNLERRHGGEALAPNCKPTYLSVMNYLYQLRGLLDDSGRPHLDFSGGTGGAVNESTLGPDGAQLPGLGYRIGWYAPFAGSIFDFAGGPSPARSHCDGSPLEGESYIRVDRRTKGGPIDWDADGVADATNSFDVNFNGPDRGLEILADSNDWAAIKLNQIGARRNTGGLYVDSNGDLYVGPLSADTGRGDLGRGDLGRGDLGRGDLGRGDLGRGDLGRGDLGRGDLGQDGLGRGDLGRGDLGRGDLGGGDYFANNPYPEGELDFETAGDLAKTPPTEFKACVNGVGSCSNPSARLHAVLLSWKAPTVGGVQKYVVYRVTGPELTNAWVKVGETADATTYSMVDASALVNGEKYTYFAVAVYPPDPNPIQSDPSNLETITAVEDKPTIAFTPAGPYSIFANKKLDLTITVTDEDPASVTLSGTSSLKTLVPDANIVFGGTGATRTLTVTPAQDQVGDTTIVVTATDQGGQKVTSSFVLTVKPVVYQFIGFLSPLVAAGSDGAPSDSGTFTYGKAVPVKYQLKLDGAFITSTTALKDLVAVPGTGTSCTPTTAVPTLDLLTDDGRPTGNSTYRYDTNNNQFIFNWDTSAANKAYCYRLRLKLSDTADVTKSPWRVTVVRFR